MMQQFKYMEPQGLSSRRNGFMRDIRNIQREDFKKKARSQMLTRTTVQQINYLINITKQSINNQDLERLIKLANQHNHKAVAHLGNLIIDGVVKVKQLERFTLQPDFHPYWLWLVEVLVENSYCTIGLFQHCVKTISPTRLEKAVKHALTILYKITSSNMYSSFLMKQENILLSIINATFRQDSASKIAYLLINVLIIKEEGLAERLSEGILRQRMISSLKNGLNSSIPIIKRDCFKILKDLAIKHIYYNDIQAKMISFIKSEDFINHSQEYLEYLLEFSISGERDQVISMIDQGLLIELSQWKKFFENNEDYIAGKIIQIGRQIKERVNDSNYLCKGIQRELQRLNLLSFDPTIIEY